MARFPLTERTRNFVRFGHHLDHETLDQQFRASFAFRDRASRLSVLKSVGGYPGPDEGFVHAQVNPETLFAKTLGAEWSYPGQPARQRQHQQLYNSMNYYRSHVEEVFTHTGASPQPPFEGRCLFHMRDVDRLAIRYEMRNTSATELPLRLRFFAEPRNARLVEAEASGFRTRYTFDGPPGNYDAAVRLVAHQEDVAFEAVAGRLRSRWIERTLAPHETAVYTFELELAVGADEPTVRSPLGARELEDAMADAEAAYASLPALPERFREHHRLALNAVGVLRSLRYRDVGPDGREVTTVHAGKCGLAASWWWDGAFALIGLGDAGQGDAGRDMARLLLQGVREDGQPPCTAHSGRYHYQYQQPIMAWGLSHLLGPEPDPAFLGEIYEPLARYVTHWLESFDKRGEGLVVHPPGATCLDDALRWQSGSPIAFEPGETWYEHEWGRSEPSRYELPDTNSFLNLECRALARFARALGRPDEADAWQRRAETIAQAVNEHLWDAERGMYGDRHVETGNFAGLATPSTFMPIYAGIAPPERAEPLLRDVLLDPNRFNTTLPFPTMDRSHPAFRSGGFLFQPPAHPGSLVQQAYWRGRTWPHMSYWMVGALWQAGLTEEADAAADRILDGVGRYETIYECYDPLTGMPNGHAEFMWSSASVIALAARRYSMGPLGDTPRA